MLNWDEYNKEEAQAAPAIKSAIPEEVKETQPIVQEVSEPAEATPASVEEGSRAEIARKAIENFDESLVAPITERFMDLAETKFK